MGRVKAVVFDMDGVLVDSEAVYQDAVERFFSERHVALRAEELHSLVGSAYDLYRRTIAEWWQRVPDPDPAEAAMGVEAAIAPYYPQDPSVYADIVKPGLEDTLAGLAARGITMAVASSSSLDEIGRILDACGIENRFRVIVSGTELEASKPDPAIYLRAMDLLGAKADECVAVEDSDTGIASAVGAGIRVAALRDTRFGFSQSAATWVIDELPDLLPLVDFL